MDLTKKSDIELKALAFDELVRIEELQKMISIAQNNIKILNDERMNRINKVAQNLVPPKPATPPAATAPNPAVAALAAIPETGKKKAAKK